MKIPLFLLLCLLVLGCQKKPVTVTQHTIALPPTANIVWTTNAAPKHHEPESKMLLSLVAASEVCRDRPDADVWVYREEGWFQVPCPALQQSGIFPLEENEEDLVMDVLDLHVLFNKK